MTIERSTPAERPQERGGAGAATAHRIRQVLRSRPRLAAAVVTGMLLLGLLPASWQLSTRLLVAWDTGVLLYLGFAWTMMGRSGVDHMRQRAAQQDEGEFLVLSLTLAASAASLGAILAELHGVRAAPAGELWRVALALATILCSWFFVHTTFALHYAKNYYAPTDNEKPRALLFPEHVEEPSYWDFQYFAFTIGAASQTSDVAIASAGMRRSALIHTVFSFLFNTMVLALAVNVGASLV